MSSNARPHKCLICDQDFTTRRGLKRHGLVHSDVRAYKCSQCPDKAFKRPDGLTSHTLHCHTDFKPFQCGDCDARFKLACGLTKHMVVHNQTRNFECGKCKARFKTKQALNNHWSIHIHKPLLQCGQCESKFRNKIGLRRHEKSVHTGTRSHKCPDCDKAFKRVDHLKQHRGYVHSELKRFECELCEYKTKSMGELREHLRRKHTMERAYACPDCDKAFKTRSSYSKHRQVHTGISQQCKVCGSWLKLRRSMPRHIKKRHPNATRQLEEFQKTNPKQLVLSIESVISN